MTGSEQLRTALKLVNEINRHDVPAIVALLARDHLWVEPSGREVRGPDRARDGWVHVFARFPEYHIAIEDALEAGPVVGMMGVVTGAVPAAAGPITPAQRWRVSAAWKVVVRDGRVERFQAFSDEEPIRRLESLPAPPA